MAKEKVTKEKGHPAWRLLGILPNKSVSRGRAFRTGILPVRKGADIPVGSRYAACRPRLTAAQGPRVEQRAILARTRCATAARLRERTALRRAESVLRLPSDVIALNRDFSRYEADASCLNG